MKSLFLSLLLFLAIISTSLSQSSNKESHLSDNLLNKSSQNGSIEFASSHVERFAGSENQSEQINLVNYSGLPLKALQFKIVIASSNKSLIFKSLTRGKNIPESQFLFDYEVHEGLTDSAGNPILIISALFLGNDYNAIDPGMVYHIASLNYDLAEISEEQQKIDIVLKDVMGTTAMPVQDAGICAGQDLTILIKKSADENFYETILSQNFPNPFNPTTKIRYTVPSADEGASASFPKVMLKVYDVLGSEITTLVDKEQNSGAYELMFDASLVKSNANYISGVYIYKLVIGNFVQTRKMILLK